MAIPQVDTLYNKERLALEFAIKELNRWGKIGEPNNDRERFMHRESLRSLLSSCPVIPPKRERHVY